MAGTEDRAATREEDDATEGAVLFRVLDLHPAQVTVAELILDLGGEEPDFATRDAIERAVRDLIRAGLLHHHHHELLAPTRAALRFNELADR